jgi:hypothetical protein
LGASRSSSTTNTNITRSERRTDAAPFPTERTGFVKPSAKLTSFGEFFLTQDSM